MTKVKPLETSHRQAFLPRTVLQGAFAEFVRVSYLEDLERAPLAEAQNAKPLWYEETERTVGKLWEVERASHYRAENTELKRSCYHPDGDMPRPGI